MREVIDFSGVWENIDFPVLREGYGILFLYLTAVDRIEE